ncbi:hypothetical protein N7539_008866 [Penicillium diatomitis]|uniref:Hydrophobin n=1 Tax=Penicillium diatomitis TaxID=2819901 RepID=A0A9W9WLA3_9EURO|nr:uncharacterized protein N7539_008866 [Penicillium diatomitis]KAJ5469248.1 hypothetical protein N7539_008866 [Penicillium diatomitis]
MRASSVLITLFGLVATGLAEKSCTPSFDYCSDYLIQSKGFTEADLKAVLKGTDLENADLKNVLFHCKNPGDVGHAVLCTSECKNPATEGSHKCDG